MTKLLERAYERMNALSEEDQDAVAALVLEVLEDETVWQDLFARSQDQLALLSDAAVAEHRAGHTLPLDPEAL